MDVIHVLHFDWMCACERLIVVVHRQAAAESKEDPAVGWYPELAEIPQCQQVFFGEYEHCLSLLRVGLKWARIPGRSMCSSQSRAKRNRSSHVRRRCRTGPAGADSKHFQLSSLRRQRGATTSGRRLALSPGCPGGLVVQRAPSPRSPDPTGTLPAQRSHVAGRRAPIHVSIRPHVPAFARGRACQMRTGGSS